MSAAEALKAARAAGIELGIDGDDLVLEAAAPPPAAVLDLPVAAQGRDRGAAAARPRRLVGRGLAGLLRRAGGDRRVRWRAAACGGRGPSLRLLRRRMAEPQSCALAARALSRLRRSRTCPRSAAALRHRTHRPCLAAFALLARLVRGPERPRPSSALAAMGITAPVVRPMKQEERSEHLPSDATRESRTAKNQFAFQRQMNGG